jgi:hypothetical protein
MKLTPCNPAMLQARDTILQADVNNINAGANRCAITPLGRWPLAVGDRAGLLPALSQ